MIHACLVEKETMKSLYKYKANMKAGPRRVRIVKVLSDGIVHLEILELNPRNFHRRVFSVKGLPTLPRAEGRLGAPLPFCTSVVVRYRSGTSPTQTIICATPCPPKVLLPTKPCPLTPARA